MTSTSSLVAVRCDGDVLELLDQRRLPSEEVWIACRTAAEAAAAIRDMVVRGAPAIAIAAAYGLAVDVRGGGDRASARAVLAASRPTAVNLRWALERLDDVADADLYDAARALHEEDVATNRALGDVGDVGADALEELVPRGRIDVLTHCNTGALATGGWGTALGVVRSLVARGRDVHVVVDETRPYLQGARLTAWELAKDGIPCTLQVDAAAAVSLSRGVHAVVVGCDRVAVNGDTANKIGTLGLAVLARHFGVPFYVAMPLSTLDPRCPDGAAIPIEERDGAQVRGWGRERWAADVPVFDPAFDVTPRSLVTGWFTEIGPILPPFRGFPAS